VTVIPYRRTVEQLQRVASNFWPTELSEQQVVTSVLPKLLETQEDFLAILKVPVADVENIFRIVDESSMPANLFLKHLAVLADFGGEPLKNVSAHFKRWFPDGIFTYLWTRNDTVEERSYKFKVVPTKSLSNDTLGLTGKKLLKKEKLSDLHKDAIVLLLLGGAATSENVASALARCEISDYLGQSEKLDKFVRQRYLWVSRATGGAEANSMGQLAQQTVRAHLEQRLGITGVTIKSNGHIPGIQHTGADDERETTFDLVVARGQKFVGVEVSFQVTTNSTIERKSGQAQRRYEQIDAKGYKIAYILDGAGNFRRVSALRTICNYSHCTVAFSASELDVLCDFIREYFTGS
jgi:hypothetical protein